MKQKIPFRASTVILAALLAGCTTVVPQADQNGMLQQAQQLLQNCACKTVFLAYPSEGKQRDDVFMSQRAVTGKPPQHSVQLAQLLSYARTKDLCFVITGASSARTAYIIKEAFGLTDQQEPLPHLTLVFFGELRFQQELRQLVESRKGTFYFQEYQPPVKAE